MYAHTLLLFYERRYQMNNILKYSSKLFFLGLAASAIALATNVPATAEETPQAGQELVNRADGQWIKDATGWWFKYPDGTYPKNQWKQINSRYYYFNNQGYITTGWKQLTGFNKHKEVSWYYFDPTNGDMKTGWQAINGKWYYFDPTEGYMLTGVKQIGAPGVRKYYYLHPTNGDMQTGWHKLPHSYANGETIYYWRYFDPEDGHRVEGWRKIDGDWYHFTRGMGVMSSSAWNGQYYLKEDGKMAHDETLLIRGKYYTFNSDGIVTSVKEK